MGWGWGWGWGWEWGRRAERRDGLQAGQGQVGARVQRPVTPLAETEAVPAGARDHGGVVGVQARARNGDAGEPRQALGGAAREGPAAGDAAPPPRRVAARGAHGAPQLGDEHVEPRGLDRRPQ